MFFELKISIASKSLLVEGLLLRKHSREYLFDVVTRTVLLKTSFRFVSQRPLLLFTCLAALRLLMR
jgi:hypothetical protein